MSENKTQILINDACILFDLIDLNLINAFFIQDCQFYTTIHVYNEFIKEDKKSVIVKHVNSGKLRIDNYNSIESIIHLYDMYPALSFSDCSLLELAIRIKAILLTSDKRLRIISEKNSVVVKGLLGVIYQMFQDRIITPETAIEKLEEYPNINSRAPVKETRELINKIKKI